MFAKYYRNAIISACAVSNNLEDEGVKGVLPQALVRRFAIDRAASLTKSGPR